MQVGRKGQRRKYVEKRTDVGIRSYESHQPGSGSEPRSRASAKLKPVERVELTSSRILYQEMSCEFLHTTLTLFNFFIVWSRKLQTPVDEALSTC